MITHPATLLACLAVAGAAAQAVTSPVLASSTVASTNTTSSSFASGAPVATATVLPFTPAGGIGTNSTPPVYAPLSDFDFQSLNLALNQEWIELDLFHYGLAKFSRAEFEAAGVTLDYQFLIEYMADQEVDHSTLLGNILQGKGAKPCKYKYDFTTVSQFLDFCQKLTRFGESGVYGFLPHLDSRPSAQLLLRAVLLATRGFSSSTSLNYTSTTTPTRHLLERPRCQQTGPPCRARDETSVSLGKSQARSWDTTGSTPPTHLRRVLQSLSRGYRSSTPHTRH